MGEQAFHLLAVKHIYNKFCNRANINCVNVSTGMTPCHCAALQGHGRVLMTLLENAPNLTAKDFQERSVNVREYCNEIAYTMINS